MKLKHVVRVCLAAGDIEAQSKENIFLFLSAR